MVELGPPRMASTVRRFSVPVTRRRYDAPAARNGEGLRVYPAPTASPIVAHVFEVGLGALERLPDGREVPDEVEVHSPAADLRAGDEQTGALPDEIVWQGATYEITSVLAWQGGATADGEIWLQCRGKRVEGRPAAP